MKKIYPLLLPIGRTKQFCVLMCYITLIIFFSESLQAQVTNPTTPMQALRQKNSFNKATLVKNKQNGTNVATLLSIKQVDSVTNPLQNIIQSLVGPGITVSNIQTTLPKTSDIYGSFSGGTNVIGMESGLIMTSGSVFNALGPNISEFTSQDNGLPGYLVSDTAGYDAAVISFDVTSTTSFLSFKYVFASEEYNEYVGSPFNDEFAFFISGPGIPAGTNIALIPGTNTPVAINNVNLGLNSQYYINNDSAGFVDPVKFQNLEYDGLTTVLTTAAITVVPGAKYTITLVIQDFEDAIYDSGVFLEGGSITSDSCVLDLHAIKKDISCNGANDGSINLLYSGANGTPKFAWSNGATSEDINSLAPGSYNVTVTDEKGCTATLKSDVVIIEPLALSLNEPIITGIGCDGGSKGSALVSATGGIPPYQYTLDTIVNNSGLFANLNAGTYNYSASDSNECVTSGSFVIPVGSGTNCTILVKPSPIAPGLAANTIYLGIGPQSVTLTGIVKGGKKPYKYDWGFDTARCITVSPTITTTYNLIITDNAGCQSNCNVTIYVIDVRCGKDLQKILVCHKDSATQQWKTLCVKRANVHDHLEHGDILGACTSFGSTGMASEIDESVKNKMALNVESLQIKVSPNPTTNYFSIQINNIHSTEQICLRIFDMYGRKIEVMDHITPGGIITIGNNYKPGTYIVEITQGNLRKTIRLIKTGG